MEKINKIFKKLNNLKFIILIIIILGGAFYWFELRPIQIRKNCLYVSSCAGDEKGLYARLCEEKRESTESEYFRCLRFEGLNK
jgi:hypothetical protein